jgi:hypothetical protein
MSRLISKHEPSYILIILKYLNCLGILIADTGLIKHKYVTLYIENSNYIPLLNLS